MGRRGGVGRLQVQLRTWLSLANATFTDEPRWLPGCSWAYTMGKLAELTAALIVGCWLYRPRCLGYWFR